MAWKMPWTVFHSFGNIKNNLKDGYHFGDILAGWYGFDRTATDRSQMASPWKDITGQTNTETQNSAAAALQEDAQAFNSSESAQQRAWESEEAQKNRDWQTEMSNTAVQRMAADYKAAGFNPILAASGNGASLGSPVMSTGSAASSAVGATQASNVNALAAVGTAAAGIGILIKALKAVK